MRFLYLVLAFAMACVPVSEEPASEGGMEHRQISHICEEGEGRAVFDLGGDPRNIELRICIPDAEGQVCELVHTGSHATLEQFDGFGWEMSYPCLAGELLTIHYTTPL